MLVVNVVVDNDIARGGFGVDSDIDIGVVAIDVGSIIDPGRFPELRFCKWIKVSQCRIHLAAALKRCTYSDW